MDSDDRCIALMWPAILIHQRTITIFELLPIAIKWCMQRLAQVKLPTCKPLLTGSIYDEEVDILIDLGWFGGGRMDIFSLRPSPIQLVMCGFASTVE